MQLLDVLGALLVLGAAAAFTLGAIALAHANDAEALYYLIVGFIGLRSGIQIVRPGAST